MTMMATSSPPSLSASSSFSTTGSSSLPDVHCTPLPDLWGSSISAQSAKMSQSKHFPGIGQNGQASGHPAAEGKSALGRLGVINTADAAATAPSSPSTILASKESIWNSSGGAHPAATFSFGAPSAVAPGGAVPTVVPQPARRTSTAPLDSGFVSSFGGSAPAAGPHGGSLRLARAPSFPAAGPNMIPFANMSAFDDGAHDLARMHSLGDHVAGALPRTTSADDWSGFGAGGVMRPGLAHHQGFRQQQPLQHPQPLHHQSMGHHMAQIPVVSGGAGGGPVSAGSSISPPLRAASTPISMPQPVSAIGHEKRAPGAPNPLVKGSPAQNGMTRSVSQLGTATSPTSRGSAVASANGSANGGKKTKQPTNTELYKTELCASYMNSGGNCPYGDKCQFAHGEHDLKIVDRPPKWRSKPCQNWLKSGACSYNDRCCFRHD